MRTHADVHAGLLRPRMIGTSWLVSWAMGALLAWWLPWAPLGDSWSPPWRVMSRLLADGVSVLLQSGVLSHPSLALAALLALSLGVIRFNQHLSFQPAPASGLSPMRAFRTPSKFILMLALFVSGLWWSLANMAAFVQRAPLEFVGPLSCQITIGVTGLPKPGHHVWHLPAEILAVPPDAGVPACQQFQPGQRLRVSDYARFPPAYAGGQVWHLNLRLKPPHGSLNPGGFDYERWLFAQRIVATATVRGTPTLRASVGPGWLLHLAAVRAQIRANLLAVSKTGAPENPGRGLLLGLTIGDGDFLSRADWDVLLATGTNHLLAISGLHVGMVAGLFAWLAGGLWARTRFCEALPARRIAATAAVIAAWGYALLAGMSVPTERTALMITILLAGVLLGRSWRMLDLWLLAVMGVLFLDPFSPLTAGFWLSFGAVLMMVLWLQHRSRLSFWRDALRLQIVLTLALLPLVWMMFDRIAWSSLPANLLAVPLITLLITPLSLVTVLFAGWAPSIAGLLVLLIDGLAHGLFAFLRFLADWAPNSLVAAPAVWTLLLAGLGVAWLLMPRSWPHRYLGLVLCLPAVLYRPPAVPEGQADIWLLDVGQGMAVVVKTAHHCALYDTGPAFGSSDAGARTVIPALRALGVPVLDRIIISHHARDHAGGLGSVLKAYPGTPVISGEPLPGVSAQACRDGENWQWDGVHFELFQAENMHRDNNRSCVMRLTDRQGRLLLTGDIEKRAERDLIARHDLKADWLYVPHHGSKTSSSPAFLKAVHPQIALVSAGKFNQFHHPSPRVVHRYQRAGVPVLNTAVVGAIHVSNGRVTGYRPQSWPFVWRYVDGPNHEAVIQHRYGESHPP